jgi:hypothetical protein
MLNFNLIKFFNINFTYPEIFFIFENEVELINFNWENLKKKNYIIKANHGSGLNVIIDSDRDPSESELRQIEKWFKINSDSLNNEMHYKLIKKRVFVEELLDENLLDYKVFCMNGVCKVVQVDFNRFTTHSRVLYDLNWNKLPFEYVYSHGDCNIEKPILLNDIIYNSELIAKHFEFVRVDWYIVKEKLYLGEITFHPEGGLGPFLNIKQDREFLQYLLEG